MICAIIRVTNNTGAQESTRVSSPVDRAADNWQSGLDHVLLAPAHLANGLDEPSPPVEVPVGNEARDGSIGNEHVLPREVLADNRPGRHLLSISCSQRVSLGHVDPGHIAEVGLVAAEDRPVSVVDHEQYWGRAFLLLQQQYQHLCAPHFVG